MSVGMAMGFSENSGDWAWLPKDLLESILERLVPISDYVRFSAVCKPWHCVAIENHRWRRVGGSAPNQLPMLMVPTKDNSHEMRSLYSITDGKIYHFQLSILNNNKRCCGSSHGWLAIADDTLAITLLNPFTGGTICLPLISEVPRDGEEYAFDSDYIVTKLILSADPSLTPDGYKVVAIIDDSLAFIKSGDKAWTYYKLAPFVWDVIFYKGQVHAVDCWSNVSSINNWDLQSKANLVAPRPSDEYYHRTYIVESSEGDLLLVQRLLGGSVYDEECELVTEVFKVYKLLCPCGGLPPKWVEIKSLGDQALFLGTNSSMSVLAWGFPGCHPNCIYYTYDCTNFGPYEPHACGDIGVFNLENERFGTHYTFDPSQRRMPPAVWIVPTLQGNWV